MVPSRRTFPVALLFCISTAAAQQAPPAGAPKPDAGEQTNASPARVVRHLLRLQQSAGSVWYRDRIDGRAEGTKLRCEVVRELTVVAMKPERADVRQTIHRLVLSGSLGGGDFHYDSDRDGRKPPPGTGTIAVPAGTTMEYGRDERGRILDYELPRGDRIREAPLFAGVDGGNAIFGLLPRFPEGPVAIGDTWRVQTAAALVGPIQEFTIEHRLERVDSGIATIALLVELPEAARQGPGPRLERLRGTCDLDLAKGVVVRARTELKTLEPGAGKPREFEFTTELIERPVAKGGSDDKPGK